MSKVKCRIISVNSKVDVQDFGHTKNDAGEKIRYTERRKKIDLFLQTFKSEYFDIEYFDAVTPNKFTMGDKAIVYNGNSLELSENSVFYAANTLSHYDIWNIDEDTLIVEDDIIFTQDIFDKISSIIEDFKEIKSEKKILYLQASVPWMENADDKQFSLSSVSYNLGKFKYGDLSGTAGYFIPKETKKILLNNMRGICACDRYLESLVKDNIIEYYLPLDKTNMVRLDKTTMWL